MSGVRVRVLRAACLLFGHLIEQTGHLTWRCTRCDLTTTRKAPA